MMRAEVAVPARLKVLRELLVDEGQQSFCRPYQLRHRLGHGEGIRGVDGKTGVDGGDDEFTGRDVVVGIQFRSSGVIWIQGRYQITPNCEIEYDHDIPNHELIVAAVNACFTINPSNPLAVAEAMPELVGAAKGLLAFIHEKFPKDFEPGGNGYLCPHHRAIAAALAKLEAK